MTGLSLGLGLGLNVLYGRSGVPALPAQTFQLGIYPYNGTDPTTHIAASEAWLGAPYDMIRMFAGDKSNIANWGNALNVESALRGKRVCWGFPLTASGVPLSDIAAGTYDANVTALFNRVLEASAGYPGVIYIDLGWEFSGNYDSWTIVDGTDGVDMTLNPTKAANYVQAWQHVVPIGRSISSRFKFVWTPDHARFDQIRQEAIDSESAYPGDDYVDVIGLDWYCPSSVDGDEALFNNMRSGFGIGYGLDWQVSFAAAHGKPIAWPETGSWGVDRGGLVDLATAYALDNDIIFLNYWDSDADGRDMLSDGGAGTTGTRFVVDFGPPEITSTASADAIGDVPFAMTRMASKPVTWQTIGGADKSIFVATGADIDVAAQTWVDGGDNLREVTWRAVDNRRQFVTQDFELTIIEAAAPWTPTELGTDVVGWFDADDDTTITQVSGVVSAMASKASNFSASQGTAGFRPGYSATGRNGKPAILFDGTNDCLAFTPPASFPDGTEAYTMICVGYNDGTGVFTTYNGKTIFQYGSGTSVLRGIDRNGTGSAAANVDDTYVNNVGDWDAKDAMVLVEKAAGASALATVYVNDNATGTGTTGAGSLSASAGRIGANVVQTTTAFWPGSIQEILVINRVLTTTERQKMFGYLAHKWGLTALLPADHPYKSAPPEL
jgi:hypothetical protein